MLETDLSVVLGVVPFGWFDILHVPVGHEINQIFRERVSNFASSFFSLELRWVLRSPPIMQEGRSIELRRFEREVQAAILSL